MSETPNQVQIQIPSRQIFLDLNNPLDKVIYSLTERRRKLEEVSKAFKEKVDQLIKSRIEILKEYGYTIEKFELKEDGILYYVADITITSDRNLYFDLPDQYNQDSEIVIDNHSFKIRVRIGKWGTIKTEITIHITITSTEYQYLLEESEEDQDE